MEFRPFGRTGFRISVVGLGCGGFGGVGSERALFGQGESQTEAFALMDAAHASGINYFDTTNTYGGGRSEEMVGHWLEQRRLRHAIFLGTKVGTPLGEGPNEGGLSRRHMLTEVEKSLRRLRTDWIDLYMAHQVDHLTSLEETLRSFESLVSSGKVRYVGICNYEAWRLAKACWIADRHGLTRFESIQNEYNLLAQDSQRETIAFAIEEQIAFMAHSPLAGGLLTGKYLEVDALPPNSRLSTRPGPYQHLRRPRVTAQTSALREVASDLGMTMAALSLAWVMSTQGVTTILVGPRRPDQLNDAILAAKRSLDATERLAIVEAITHAAESI